MMVSRTILTSLILFILLGTPLGQAAPAPAMPVMWQQPQISLQQVQSIFASNPGLQQLNIRFPNGTMWNADIGNINNMADNYLRQVQSMGFRGEIPPLSFSSLATKPNISGGMANIPIGNIGQDIEQNIANITQSMKDELEYQKYQLASYLPEWLKNLISMAWDGFMILYDFAIEEIKKWLN